MTDNKVQKLAYFDSREVQKPAVYGIQKGSLSITSNKTSAVSSVRLKSQQHTTTAALAVSPSCCRSFWPLSAACARPSGVSPYCRQPLQGSDTMSPAALASLFPCRITKYLFFNGSSGSHPLSAASRGASCRKHAITHTAQTYYTNTHMAPAHIDIQIHANR